MRFHLRHASACSSSKLCLLKASSLCLARRASRPFFFPLASTKPHLSEPGRSFGPCPLAHLSAHSENPRRFSVVIPLKSSYRAPFPGLFPGGRLQPLPVLFRALQPPGFSSRRRVGVPRNLPSHTFLSIFFRKFLRENILKSKKISDYQYIIFLFFSNKKASLIMKEA